MNKPGERRICLVIPSLQAGGMERVMSELAWFFSSKKNVTVHLVLYGISREIFFAIPDNLIVHKPPYRFNNRWRLYFTVKTLFYLRNTIRGINPVSILSFGEYWNNFVLIALIGLKYPVFISDRSQPNKSLGRIHDTLRHWLYPLSKGLILQTEVAKEIFLKKNQHSNIAVIGNPVPLMKSGDSIQLKEKTILMVGRLIKTKHQDTLIEMFARVGSPDWKLRLVGYDHLKQQNMKRLKSLAIKLGVKDKVIFDGKQENMDKVYRNSSIFAFTSSSEGFPNVIGEAMASGLPVIAFDCIAGPSEMITDGHDGYLIPLFDYASFESRLFQLMGDEELRNKLGSNARESVKKFSTEKMCGAFYRFITE